MPQHSTAYTIGFAAAVCGVCSLFVAGSAVALKPRQLDNKAIDRQLKVLAVAGLMEGGEDLSKEQVRERYDQYIQPVVVDLKTGAPASDVDAKSFDQQEAMANPASSAKAPENPAKVQRIPNKGVLFKIVKDGKLDGVIFPVQGKGLWSTMYGYLALEADGNTVKGITFYEHGETPGLGGEIENPLWQSLWPGRQIYDREGVPKLQVVKGQAGSVADDPYAIDGLSGATLTSRGVTGLVQFWLGENGYGPYVERLRAEKGEI
ncbi:MAG: Na(+)-translocating NADH-quinone reductase subunit C [Myxococcales bacterium]|nr:Na(+)-translocating NADH-quinone reductase subunit C [Myxococcales bacterium]